MVGHVTKDLANGGHRVGGTAAYASVTARRLGLNTAVVTSIGVDLDLESLLPGVRVHSTLSTFSTTFLNEYDGGARTQHLTAMAEGLSLNDVPRAWRATPIVLLGPIAGEVPEDMFSLFPDSLIGVNVQGWVRTWDERGRVSLHDWSGETLLPNVDAAFVSVEDLVDVGQTRRWASMVPVLAVTDGEFGSRVHAGGNWHDLEPWEARQVDPTGAGDVYATAFLVRYSLTRDPIESARFASCAASLCVAAEGLDGAPTLEQVEARLLA